MQRLVHALDAAQRTRSRKSKVASLATLLKTLTKEELPIATRFILGQVLPTGDQRALGVGWKLLSAALATVAKTSIEHVGLLSREHGDMGDALEVLLPNTGSHLPLLETWRIVDRIADTPDRDVKLTLLIELFRRAAPWEARTLVKALLGEQRIGVQRGIFEDALAQAFGVPLDQLRAASALTPDPGILATLAAEGRLGEAQIVPGQVVAFMLASPHETTKQPIDPQLTVWEDKLDGIRCQAHVGNGQVRLFARGLEEVTEPFPEVARRLASMPRPVVLDGEIIAVRADGQPRPFQALQARLNRARPSEATLAKTPVAFVAYDCLFDGESLLTKPWKERRVHLEALPNLRVNPVTPLSTSESVEAQLESAFTSARSRGHEGLVLKRVDAPYEAGRRGSAWRKVKRAFATLDVVVTRAERGHGKRAGVLSDYTFGVWKGETLVEIGRAYSGLTDAEIAQLTLEFERLTVEHQGPVRLVKPEIVLEIAFDGVQKSTRHDGGFALRFPRIARWRQDKQAKDADRLESVAVLFEAQVQSGHREEPVQRDLFE